MTEFEPCPVTGEKPEKIGCEQFASYFHLQYRCPLTDKTLAVAFTQPSFEVWWRDEYLPAARKYAEYLESQKPVEFQVGDLVGPTLSAIEMLVLGARQVCCLRSRVTEIIGGKVMVANEFFRGDNRLWPATDLRLISRPKKLTLADLPEIEGIKWDNTEEVRNQFRVFLCDQQSDTMLPFIEKTEHEAVLAAREFVNKIWAAKPEGV